MTLQRLADVQDLLRVQVSLRVVLDSQAGQPVEEARKVHLVVGARDCAAAAVVVELDVCKDGVRLGKPRLLGRRVLGARRPHHKRGPLPQRRLGGEEAAVAGLAKVVQKVADLGDWGALGGRGCAGASVARLHAAHAHVPGVAVRLFDDGGRRGIGGARILHGGPALALRNPHGQVHKVWPADGPSILGIPVIDGLLCLRQLRHDGLEIGWQARLDDRSIETARLGLDVVVRDVRNDEAHAIVRVVIREHLGQLRLGALLHLLLLRSALA
mmetsp:Transcript_24164/g.71705  ORF Transcript_24164/g.71705 Transcript_24164/m.71705 type:complete len:270 (-) Transcript_24164:150-959(-)